jgi:hypothetical protein
MSSRPDERDRNIIGRTKFAASRRCIVKGIIFGNGEMNLEWVNAEMMHMVVLGKG